MRVEFTFTICHIPFSEGSNGTFDACVAEEEEAGNGLVDDTVVL
jgi:hypothetical protein